MGAQGNAPMCRGLGCVPGSMSRRRRAQLASYPGIGWGMPGELTISNSSPGESHGSRVSRMQRRRASVDGHHRSVPNSPHGKVWSRGDNPGESYIVTSGEDADVWIDEHRRG